MSDCTCESHGPRMIARERVQTQLDEVEAILKAYSDAAVEEWSPEWMAMQSLLSHQADLLHEQRLLEGTSDTDPWLGDE